LATSIEQLLFRLSNFYDLFPDEDREFIKQLWTGYSTSISDLYLQLYQIDQAKSIDTITPTIRREWLYVDLSYLKAVGASKYAIEPEIESIPALQQGISVPGSILQSGVDYKLTPGFIEFTSDIAKAAASKVLRLVGPLGDDRAVKRAIDAGALTGLVSGTDYLWAGGTAPIRLYSKAAFDVFVATKDVEIIQVLLESRLWAPTVFVDEQLVYDNFGFLLDFPHTGTGFSLEIYTRIVKGLWFVVWNGPTPRNIRSGLSLIFNYPTVSEAGTVVRVSTELVFDSVTNTLVPVNAVTIRTATGAELVTPIPQPFRSRVVAGDVVTKFEAISNAVDVYDEVNSPGWWSTNLGVARYVVPGAGFSAQTPLAQFQAKALLRHFNAGVKLKAFDFTVDLDVRARLARSAVSFLELIRPVYARFAFLGQDTVVSGPADTVGMSELKFTADLGGQGLFALILNQTVGNNFRNRLIAPDEVRPPAAFTTYAAYLASAVGATPFNFGDDWMTMSEVLAVRVYKAGGAITGWAAAPLQAAPVLETDANYLAFRASRIVDDRAPILKFNPPEGLYPTEFFAEIATQEMNPILATFNGTDPRFANNAAVPPVTQNGVRISGPLVIPVGTRQVKLLTKNSTGVTTSRTLQYVVPLELSTTFPSPNPLAPGARNRASVNVIFFNSDPTASVYYALGGKAPTDTPFPNLARLNGLKIELVGNFAVRLTDPGIPIDFPSGRSTVNREGASPKVIEPKPFTRYFAYAEKLGNGSWVLSFKHFNTTLVPENDNLLLVGFVIADHTGKFFPEGLVNAVDADSVRLAVRDAGATAAGLGAVLSSPLKSAEGPGIPINRDNPVSLSSNVPQTLRWFSKRSVRQDMFELPQRAVYEFDSKSPTARIKSSLTSSPFFNTLVVTLESDDPNAAIYYSTETVAPEEIVFGFARALTSSNSLVSELRSLFMVQKAPNIVAPSYATLPIMFHRVVAGQRIDVLTSGDLVAGKATALSLNAPSGAASNGNTLYIADTDNHRVLVYANYATVLFPGASGPSATSVLGQVNFTNSATQVISASSMYQPRAACVIGTKLVVVDAGNNRVLIWNTIPTGNGIAADVVLGQANFTSGNPNRGVALTSTSAAAGYLFTPTAVTTDGTKLIVADTNNSRVLIWNTVPSVSGTSADVVLGQANFNARGANFGGSIQNNGLSLPRGVSVSGTKLVVADTGNSRVLVWNAIPTVNATAADRVIGQADFGTGSTNRGDQNPSASSLDGPEGVALFTDLLYVSDTGNNRVLSFNLAQTGDLQATLVIGQPNFTTVRPAATTPVASTTLNVPVGVVAFGSTLVVVSQAENRALAFDPLPSANLPAASKAVGQTNLTDSAPNRSTQVITIPNVPGSAFFDVSVVPDFNQPTKWRLELGVPNVPAKEAIDRYLVSRIRTDASGVLDVYSGAGSIQSAATGVGGKTKKYIEPVILDASAGNFEVTFAFFSVDAVGNPEAVQIVTLKPNAA